MSAKPAPTLNEALRALGLSTKPGAHHRKQIIRDGAVVFEGRAWQVWEWLAGLKAEGAK